MCILEDFIELFKYIKMNNYLAILITNQQGIGKGLMTLDELNIVHNYIQEKMLKKTGFEFDDIFICPDLAETNSYHRKPNPGMILDAIAKWNLEPKECWMIGDRKSDVVAGKRAAVNTILIGNYNISEVAEADHIFLNLYQTKEFFEKIIRI